MDLASKHCKPCEGGVEPFNQEQIDQYMEVVSGWAVSDDLKSIRKEYSFKNFKEAWDFVNHIGTIAESEGHHPDIEFGWGYVHVSLTTHAITGLSENDFILAYKIDQTA